MKFNIDGLPVIFPYPKIYPEQYAYMCDLKSKPSVAFLRCHNRLMLVSRNPRHGWKLRLGNAFRYRQDHLTLVAHRRISTAL